MNSRPLPLILAPVLGLLAGGIILRGSVPHAPASRRTSTSAPSSRPATSTRPASAPASGPAVSAAMCLTETVGLRAKLTDAFNVTVHPPFVVIGNLPPDKLGRYARGSVVRPAKAMWASYFRRRPDKVITVLLFADQRTYRLWADKLYGDRAVPHFGYYKPDKRTLVMNIATGTGTLVHELTHALIVYDFPTVPAWFNEGLASLHEQCVVGERKITGLTNWRLPGLQDAIRAGKLRPLRELVTKRDFYGGMQGINYAQARYFVMYMQHRGVLGEFYARFRGRRDAKKADVEAVEHVFARKIDEVEADFIRWVKTLRFDSP